MKRRAFMKALGALPLVAVVPVQAAEDYLAQLPEPLSSLLRGRKTWIYMGAISEEQYPSLVRSDVVDIEVGVGEPCSVFAGVDWVDRERAAQFGEVVHPLPKDWMNG